VSTRTYSAPARAPRIEHRHTFACFGGECTVIVADADRPADAAAAAAMARRALLGWHRRFSRFEPDSELMGFNRDPRHRVPVSPMLGRLIEVALTASRDTGGLVDATLGAEIELVGYGSHFDGEGIPLEQALSLAPPRRRGHPLSRCLFRPGRDRQGGIRRRASRDAGRIRRLRARLRRRHPPRRPRESEP
jgi:thiamine biosynthesis lipoprotein